MHTVKVFNKNPKTANGQPVNPTPKAGFIFYPQEEKVVSVNERDLFRLKTSKALEVKEVKGKKEQEKAVTNDMGPATQKKTEEEQAKSK